MWDNFIQNFNKLSFVRTVAIYIKYIKEQLFIVVTLYSSLNILSVTCTSQLMKSFCYEGILALQLLVLLE